MIPINRLREYQAECLDLIRDENGKKMFNFADMVVDDSELATILKERIENDNTFLICVLPEFYMKGTEDNTEWKNITEFFILDKTDYSEHDRDSYLNIFATTQLKALAFVEKLIEDKTNMTGSMCGFLQRLNEDSIAVKPVWKKNGCNGWLVELNFDTA